MNKETLFCLTMTNLLSLIIVGGAIKQTQSFGKHSAKEWAMIAVEEEHYQLDDDGYLLTHTAVIQTPSLELVEEAEGKTYKDYLYVKDDDDSYYMAFFKHSLIVEKYGGAVEEYVYISAIAWVDNNILEKSFYNVFGISQHNIEFDYSQIIDLDIEEVEW